MARPHYQGSHAHPNGPTAAAAGWGSDYAAPEQQARTIRIRNLATDTSEDDLRRIFSQLGAVTDLWVVVDKYDNQMGLAYCEFRDIQAVQIAVSHLNGVSFKGNQIHIEPTTSQWKEERLRVLQGKEDMVRAQQMQNGSRPQRYEEPGAQQTPSSSQESSGDLANLNSEQMFNLMHQMKLCIEADPVEARNALLKNFSLSAGMLQALLMMKLVDPSEALEILMREEQPDPAPPQQVIPAPQQQPPPNVAYPPPLGPPPGYHPGYGPPPVPVPVSNIPLDPRQARGRQEYYGPPPVSQPPLHHPPPMHRPPPSMYAPQVSQDPVQPNQVEMERAGMLLQLLQMTDQQIASLPPDQRQAVLMLREQLAGQM